MKKILIVEDEKMLVDMYTDKLEYEGFKVVSAKNGEEGVKMALKEKPDLIILDVLLPKKEGTEVLKEIRESGDWGKNIPIIMFSNLDSNDHILRVVKKYSPSYYLIKAHTNLNEMVEKINQLI